MKNYLIYLVLITLGILGDFKSGRVIEAMTPGGPYNISCYECSVCPEPWDSNSSSVSKVNCAGEDAYCIKYRTAAGYYSRGCTADRHCSPVNSSERPREAWCCHGGVLFNSYFCQGDQEFPGWQPPDCVSNAYCNSTPRKIFSLFCIAMGMVLMVVSFVI